MESKKLDILIGVDVGGTFTDVVVQRLSDGFMSVDKVLTTPGKLSTGILDGIEKVLGPGYAAELPVARIVHATTQATNAIIEGNTARMALLTNKGFRDVLEIRRHFRGNIYNFFLENPHPLVDRDLRLEVDCRLAADGSVVKEIDEAQLDSVIEEAQRAGVESFAICFLHAYANPEHERIVEARVRSKVASTYTTRSSLVCPEYREYERTSTTVVNAAVMPLVDRYLSELESELQDRGYRRSLYIMQSNGGVMTSQDIRVSPVNIIESGPAAGVIAAMAVGAAIGRKHVLSFDMGGTTAKAALIEDGKVDLTNEYEVSAGSGGHGAEKQQGHPIRVPVMEIAEVGAGGGSIAWIDAGNALRVGPQSAGAAPGPVCYRQGGTRPTTTDANVVLGRLSPSYFLGGEMELDVEGARRAIAEQVAGPLGLDVVEAAAGIIEISNSHMVRALRRVSVEKGRHPKDYSLVAFGGAGPIQAAYLAEELGINEILVPRFPGVASALGMLNSDLRHERATSFFQRLDCGSPSAIGDILGGLSDQMQGEMSRSGIPAHEVHMGPAADLRYEGQAYELRVDIPAGRLTSESLQEVAQRFHAMHEKLYSFSSPDRHIEIIGLRVTVTGSIGGAKGEGVVTAPVGQAKPKNRRQVHFKGSGYLDCPVYERLDLGTGSMFSGPAIVEQKDSTTLVPPGWRALTLDNGTLQLTR